MDLLDGGVGQDTGHKVRVVHRADGRICVLLCHMAMEHRAARFIRRQRTLRLRPLRTVGADLLLLQINAAALQH